MMLQAQWFLDPDGHLVGNLYRYSMGMCSCIYPMTDENQVGGFGEFTQYAKPHFSTDFLYTLLDISIANADRAML